MFQMPKIKIRPNAVQAQIIKALRDYPRLYISQGSRGYYWGGDVKAARGLGVLRSSTINKMLNEEWLRRNEYGHIQGTEAGITAIEEFEEMDFVSVAKSGYNEAQVLYALQKRFCAPDWLFINPFHILKNHKERYVDGFALRIRSGDGRNRYLDQWAFEIKVSKSDFKSELENPEKRAPAMDFCHYFAFVAPLGLIYPSEVPEHCGLLEVLKNGKVRMKVRPHKSDSPKDVGWDFIAQVARYMIPN
jgi:hypothetical protein